MTSKEISTGTPAACSSVNRSEARAAAAAAASSDDTDALASTSLLQSLLEPRFLLNNAPHLRPTTPDGSTGTDNTLTSSPPSETVGVGDSHLNTVIVESQGRVCFIELTESQAARIQQEHLYFASSSLIHQQQQQGQNLLSQQLAGDGEEGERSSCSSVSNNASSSISAATTVSTVASSPAACVPGQQQQSGWHVGARQQDNHPTTTPSVARGQEYSTITAARSSIMSLLGGDATSNSSSSSSTAAAAAAAAGLGHVPLSNCLVLPVRRTMVKSPSLTKRLAAGGVPAANESDGGRVKRPMNAFMVWARHSRPYLAQQMPQLSNSEISIKLGELWRMLPEDIKSVYYDEAHRIKEQHERDNPGYVYRPRRNCKTGATSLESLAAGSSFYHLTSQSQHQVQQQQQVQQHPQQVQQQVRQHQQQVQEQVQQHQQQKVQHQMHSHTTSRGQTTSSSATIDALASTSTAAKLTRSKQGFSNPERSNIAIQPSCNPPVMSVTVTHSHPKMKLVNKPRATAQTSFKVAAMPTKRAITLSATTAAAATRHDNDIDMIEALLLNENVPSAAAAPATNVERSCSNNVTIASTAVTSSRHLPLFSSFVQHGRGSDRERVGAGAETVTSEIIGRALSELIAELDETPTPPLPLADGCRQTTGGSRFDCTAYHNQSAEVYQHGSGHDTFPSHSHGLGGVWEGETLDTENAMANVWSVVGDSAPYPQYVSTATSRDQGELMSSRYNQQQAILSEQWAQGQEQRYENQCQVYDQPVFDNKTSRASFHDNPARALTFCPPTPSICSRPYDSDMASLPPVQPTVSSCGVLLADDDCTDVMMDNDVNFSSTMYPFVDCYPTTDNGDSYGGLPPYWNDRTYTADMISSSEGANINRSFLDALADFSDWINDPRDPILFAYQENLNGVASDYKNFAGNAHHLSNPNQYYPPTSINPHVLHQYPSLPTTSHDADQYLTSPITINVNQYMITPTNRDNQYSTPSLDVDQYLTTPTSLNQYLSPSSGYHVYQHSTLLSTNHDVDQYLTTPTNTVDQYLAPPSMDTDKLVTVVDNGHVTMDTTSQWSVASDQNNIPAAIFAVDVSEIASIGQKTQPSQMTSSEPANCQSERANE